MSHAELLRRRESGKNVGGRPLRSIAPPGQGIWRHSLSVGIVNVEPEGTMPVTVYSFPSVPLGNSETRSPPNAPLEFDLKAAFLFKRR